MRLGLSLHSGDRSVNGKPTIILVGGRGGVALIPLTSIMLWKQTKRLLIYIFFFEICFTRNTNEAYGGVNILTQIQFVLKYVLLLKKHHWDEMITMFRQMLMFVKQGQ